MATSLTGGSKRTTVDRMVTPGVLAQRILVVDDDPLVCDSVRRMLAVDKHQVETATSGEQALGIFKVGKFDLVITDYELDLMNGVKLAAAIKALAPNQPIALITAYAETLQLSGTPLTGVDLVISKPFDLQEFRKAVSKLLTKA